MMNATADWVPVAKVKVARNLTSCRPESRARRWLE